MKSELEMWMETEMATWSAKDLATLRTHCKNDIPLLHWITGKCDEAIAAKS